MNLTRQTSVLFLFFLTTRSVSGQVADTFLKVIVVSRENPGRFIALFADCFHFSGFCFRNS